MLHDTVVLFPPDAGDLISGFIGFFADTGPNIIRKLVVSYNSGRQDISTGRLSSAGP
jgi:hypothetical protein